MSGLCCNAMPSDDTSLAQIMTDAAREAGIWSRSLETDHLDGARVMIARGWVRIWHELGENRGFLARDGAMIHALYVAPAYLGRGIGTALMQDAMDVCAELRLWTDATNTSAGQFYEKSGFAETLGVPYFASSDGVNERWFEWHRQPEKCA